MCELTLTYKGKVRNSEEAIRFWQLHNRRQRKLEKHFIPKIFKVIKNQVESFLNAIDKYGYHYAVRNIQSILKTDGVYEVIKDIYHKSAFIESNYVLNYLKRAKGSKWVDFEMDQKRRHRGDASFGLSLDSLAPLIDSYFEIHLLNTSAFPVTTSTRNMIIRRLISEVDKGKELSKAISDFKQLAITGDMPIALRRARLIATTETTRAMSFGGIIGAYMSGIDVDKIWVTSDDERVRGYPNYPAQYPHTRLDLNSSGLFDAFYNGEKIRYPGDPEASIDNTARCRCAMYFREKAKPKPQLIRYLVDFLSDFSSGLFLGISTLIRQRERQRDDKI